jgi:hypothetical protein
MKVIIVSLLVLAVVCVILAKSKSKIMKILKKMFYIFNYFCEDCPQNEIWNECGSACPTTCEKLEPRVERPLRGPIFCSLICLPQCECAKGLVRRIKDMNCILPENCRKKPVLTKYGLIYN